MNFFYHDKHRKPLTDAEKKNLIEWEMSHDPTVRFQNNYYTLARWNALDEYAEHLGNLDVDNLLEDEKAAKDQLDFQLNYLRTQYLRDLELLFELQMMMNNIFLPWKTVIVPPDIKAAV